MRDFKQVGGRGDSEWKGTLNGVESGFDILGDFIPDSFSLIAILIVATFVLVLWVIRFLGAE